MTDTSLSRRELLGSAATLGVATLAAAARAQETPAAPSPAPLAHFSFTKLVVGDLERSAAFYASTCGLVPQTRVDTESAGRKLSEIIFAPTAPGGASFVLIHYYDTPQTASGELVLGFATSDIDAFAARAAAAGGSIERAPYAIEEMKIKVAFVRDVEGHLIEVVQRVA